MTDLSDLGNEVKVLKEQNNELVQKVQYWKMTAAQRENEKLDLMKEMNQLRLKLSRMRSGGAAQVRQLHAALQVASKDAIDHLVQASNAITRSMEAANTYMRDREELDASSPRWSTLSGTPTTERVNRVPPLLIGGQSIQPVVSLSRTLLNSTTTRTVNRSPNQLNRNVTERAVPMHMLQDVYIPLTRIDVGEVLSNMETDGGSNSLDDSAENIGLEDGSEEVMEDSQNISDIDEYENTRRLNSVTEDSEPDEHEPTPPPISRARVDNPLEGPSWLLDIQNTQPRRTKCRVNLEPDSTTELEESARAPSPVVVVSRLAVPSVVGCEFSPTVRRRKRTSSPPPPTPPTPHYSPRNSMSGRVLKVMVAKMRLDEGADGGVDVSPPKRPNVASQRPTFSQSPEQDSENSAPVEESPREPRRRDRTPKRMMRFDAPSPNGATDARVIVSEAKSSACGSGDGNNCESSAADHVTRDKARDTRDKTRDMRVTARDSRDTTRDSRNTASDMRDTARDSRDAARDSRDIRDDAHDSRASRYDSDGGREMRDSDSSLERAGEETRTRRSRKQVTYKEKPLNRKLRR